LFAAIRVRKSGRNTGKKAPAPASNSPNVKIRYYVSSFDFLRGPVPTGSRFFDRPIEL
jgi:hypothetical protein